MRVNTPSRICENLVKIFEGQGSHRGSLRVTSDRQNFNRKWDNIRYRGSSLIPCQNHSAKIHLNYFFIPKNSLPCEVAEGYIFSSLFSLLCSLPHSGIFYSRTILYLLAYITRRSSPLGKSETLSSV